MAPMFHVWYIIASRGIPPHFILKSNKRFHIDSLVKVQAEVQTNSSIIRKFSKKVTNLKVGYKKSESEPDFLFKFPRLNFASYFNDMTPAMFPHLTSLSVDNCEFDNQSLLLLSPQLKSLNISYVRTDFDLSALDTNKYNGSFSKLKKLCLKYCKIDVKTILKRCYNNLKHFELRLIACDIIEEDQHTFSSLEYLHLFLNHQMENKSLGTMISKASGCLKSLKLDFGEHYTDFSELLNQDLVITTLDVEVKSWRQCSLPTNFNEFLNKCPLIQRLTLGPCNGQVKGGVTLKHLTYLTLDHCSSDCMRSLLHLTSKPLLRTLEINNLVECGYPVIPKLDTIFITSYESTFEREVLKMFPENVEVQWYLGEFDPDNIKRRDYQISRVYNLQDSTDY